jgi:hypothetical protein
MARHAMQSNMILSRVVSHWSTLPKVAELSCENLKRGLICKGWRHQASHPLSSYFCKINYAKHTQAGCWRGTCTTNRKNVLTHTCHQQGQAAYCGHHAVAAQMMISAVLAAAAIGNAVMNIQH